jgi:signal transduction histidine kinase
MLDAGLPPEVSPTRACLPDEQTREASAVMLYDVTLVESARPAGSRGAAAGGSRRTAGRRVQLLALVAAAAGVAGSILQQRALTPLTYSDLAWTCAWLSYVAVGAVLTHRRPELGIGPVLVMAGASVEIAGAVTTTAQVVQSSGHAALAAWLAWVANLLYGAYPVLVGVVIPLQLPAGRIDSQGPSRRLLWCGLAATGTWLVAGAFQPGLQVTVPVPNPLGVTAARSVLDVVVAFSEVALCVVAVLCFGRLVLQWRRASAPDRRALAYVALGGTTTLTLFIVAITASAAGLAPPAWLAALGTLVFIAALPTSVGLAVHRARFLDIELVLRRTLTYLAMTLVVVAVYVLTVLLVGHTTRSNESLATSLIVTGLAAVGLSPLRERAQRQVDRLLYGRRADPYGVLRELDTAIGRSRTPAAVLATVTEVVAHSLRLPYAVVEVAHEPGDSTRRATWGREQPIARTLELTHHGRHVGTLFLAARSPGEGFSATDDRLLSHVGDHVASAVAAVGLAEDAQQSRERLVNALEEDRRRIRRDLHDHLGPVLSGIALQLDALRRLSAGNDEVVELASTIRAEAAEAVLDVRRLVHDLRPPVLDQLGLVEALRHHAELVAAELPVTVTADPLPSLPAAVEVAAYRIVTEALTNTLRHAGATQATVSLFLTTDDLALTVSDDGCGIAPHAEPGLGLASMRDRVAELGGSLAISGDTAAGRGTKIHATLPT